MNTFDIVGAIELTASAAIVVAVLASGLGRTGRSRAAAAAAFAAWFGLIVYLAAAGSFDSRLGIGIRGVGAAAAAPVVILAWGGSRLPKIRSAIAGMPLAHLIGANAVRVLGVSFIVLYSAGRLPAPFAPVAGWGDIFIGLTALPVAWAAVRRGPGPAPLVILWNSLGLLDLLVAVGLGVTSAPDSPLRLFLAKPGSQIMGSLPWILIPGFLVPILVVTHLAIFWKMRPRAGTAVQPR
ncbi:MAG TPA: hypothetical protein VN775_08220 [Opitutaceae bacterium]|nr:hypothetical protein [Opitutaceae bacterium]